MSNKAGPSIKCSVLFGITDHENASSTHSNRRWFYLLMIFFGQLPIDDNPSLSVVILYTYTYNMSTIIHNITIYNLLREN